MPPLDIGHGEPARGPAPGRTVPRRRPSWHRKLRAGSMPPTLSTDLARASPRAWACPRECFGCSSSSACRRATDLRGHSLAQRFDHADELLVCDPATRQHVEGVGIVRTCLSRTLGEVHRRLEDRDLLLLLGLEVSGVESSRKGGRHEARATSGLAESDRVLESAPRGRRARLPALPAPPGTARVCRHAGIDQRCSSAARTGRTGCRYRDASCSR